MKFQERSVFSLNIFLVTILSGTLGLPSWAQEFANAQAFLVAGPENGFLRFGPLSQQGETLQRKGTQHHGLAVESYDKNAVKIWQRTLYSSDQPVAAAVHVDNGQIVVTGSFAEWIVADSLELRSEGGYDVFYAIYDLQGNLLGLGQVGGQGHAHALDLNQGAQGLDLKGIYEGMAFKLPLNLLGLSSRDGDELVIDVHGNWNRLLVIRFLQVAREDPFDDFGYSPISETGGGSTADPNGDPPPPPPGSNSQYGASGSDQ